MEKTFKDYAKFYMGCEIDTNLGKLLTMGFLKFSELNGEAYDAIVSSIEGIGHPSGVSDGDYYKLKLRRVSNISYSELSQIAGWAGVCMPFDWMQIEGNATELKHKKSDATFRLTDNGDCILKASNKWKDFEVTSQQIRIFKQLIDWHFDLFGLIDAGIAIDKTN